MEVFGGAESTECDREIKGVMLGLTPDMMLGLG